jgi:nicotinamide-nucleotide amidase
MSPADGRRPSLEQSVEALANALRARQWRMAAAESCTGGLIAGACTSLAGSSDWFERGWVTYSNAAKCELLGVPPGLIAEQGAVSEAVVAAMVRGAMAAAPVQAAVAVTGIAGPGGGVPGKPVGTVWLGWALRAPQGDLQIRTQCLHLKGDRRAVREQTVLAALQGLLAQLPQTIAGEQA